MSRQTGFYIPVETATADGLDAFSVYIPVEIIGNSENEPAGVELVITDPNKRLESALWLIMQCILTLFVFLTMRNQQTPSGGDPEIHVQSASLSLLKALPAAAGKIGLSFRKPEYRRSVFLYGNAEVSVWYKNRLVSTTMVKGFSQNELVENMTVKATFPCTFSVEGRWVSTAIAEDLRSNDGLLFQVRGRVELLGREDGEEEEGLVEFWCLI